MRGRLFSNIAQSVQIQFYRPSSSLVWTGHGESWFDCESSFAALFPTHIKSFSCFRCPASAIEVSALLRPVSDS